MKAITIKQPWASLIVEGIKDIENRTWSTKIRGRVLIHSGMDKKLMNVPPQTIMLDIQIEKLLNSKIDFPKRDYELYGAIIGSIEIIDCVINHSSIWAEKTDSILWHADKPIYNWVLANPIKFPEPIPAKGKLSFWDYPNILAEPEEKDGELFCHCQLSVKEENQVISFIDHYRCRYCDGRWYK